MTGRAATAPGRHRSGLRVLALALGALGLASCGSTAGARPTTTTTPASPVTSAPGSTATPATRVTSTSISTPTSTSTSTSSPPTSPPTSSAPGTTASLPAHTGAGLVVGRVTAVGDSLMLDYKDLLSADLRADGARDVVVDAEVGQQWATGVSEVEQLRSAGELGATVIVGLGTNGPVSAQEFSEMAGALSGVSRVVYVTVHVDRPWQDEVNATLRDEVPRTANGVLADWGRLAATHPGWFYDDGTHLPIDGTGAAALAHLVTTAAHPGTHAPPG